MLVAAWLLTLVTAAAAEPARPEVEIAYVDATVTGDSYEVFTAEHLIVVITGHVEITAHRVGTAHADLLVKADQVTVTAGSNEAGEATITRLEAVGHVHVTADKQDEPRGETTHLESDCARMVYDGTQELLNLYPEEGATIQGAYRYEVVPTESNEVKQPTKYVLSLTGRQSATVRFGPSPPTERRGPEGPP